MTTNAHGGARPKTRDDDARGKHHSPKPGSGRKPQSFTLKVGDALFVWAKDANGKQSGSSMVWTVTAIDRQHIDLVADNGLVWRMIR